ncbi:MAG TPA: translation initiation factor IF-2, partial [Blastocatellia bacterium]|nr:translation initiation factor IF-2 [Blastocatellia bacterium]
MATGNKIRIYDLAKELKLDNKKVIDDARREGIDVSVPSNTVPFEVAERIRTKYFPKKAAPAIGPRLVKHTKPAASSQDQLAESDLSSTVEMPEPESPPAMTRPAAPRVVEPAKPEPPRPKIRVLKATPPPVEQQPAPPPAFEPVEPEPLAAETAEPKQPIAEPVAPPPVAPAAKPAATTPRPAHQVRQLRPIPGRPMPPPVRPGASPGTSSYAGSPGAPGAGARMHAVGAETAAAPDPAAPKRQQTTYIPAQDTGRPRKRTRRGKRGPGEFGHEEGKHVEVPRHMRGPGTVVQPKSKPVFTELRPIKLIEGTTLKDFAEKLDVKAKDVVQMLLQRGVMATINQTLNQDIAREIGKEFGYDISFAQFEEMISEAEEEKMIESGEEGTASRAPVVTVMGHVDHGKTSLLDAIRQTHVAEGEAGGITQHIGAYSVNVPDPDDPSRMRNIVFLDTPGHEAFTMMRARGAKVTDVVVLVVAADDGVMPQTLEAIDHARAAEVPIIVAINKVDKPDANPDRVKQELSDRGLLWDGWGGDTVMVEVSAKKRMNLDSLLEMIILTSDLLDLKGNPDRLASGVVLEAKLDRGRGAVATVLVQQGTLKVGDAFIAGQIFGRVRAMFDDRGRPVDKTGPSTPVEVLGMQGVPHAGDLIQASQDATQAQHIAHQRQMQARLAEIGR